MKRKLVLVEWVDSHSGDRWQDLDKIEEDTGPLYCRSVGWLVARRNGTTVLVPHISGEKNGNIRLCGTGEMSIPDRAITKIRRLRG